MTIRDRYLQVLRESIESKFEAATDISDTGKAVILTIEGTGLAMRVNMEEEMDAVDMFTVCDRAREVANDFWEEYQDALSKIEASQSHPGSKANSPKLM